MDKTLQAQETEKTATENSDIINPEAYRLAIDNAKWAKLLMVTSSIISVTAAILFSFFISVRNEVIGIPSGELYEYPFVEKIFISSVIEENRKMISVAMKYIKSIYEIDSSEYSKIRTENGGFSISSKAADMLNYVPAGVKEYEKVLFAIKQSQYNFDLFSQCQCRIKFFPKQIRARDVPGQSVKVIEVQGHFENLSKDTSRPIPSEYAGNKLISIMMIYEGGIYSKDGVSASTYDAKKEQGDTKYSDSGVSVRDRGKTSVSAELQLAARPRNPEGWLVVRSVMQDMDSAALEKYNNMRLDTGLKEIR